LIENRAKCFALWKELEKQSEKADDLCAMIVDLAALETVNRCNVSEMEKVGKALNPENRAACELFGHQVKNVEAALIHTYRLVSYVAVNQESPAKAAELWKSMGEFSDLAINALRDIKGQFPYCGAPELYDLALDYKLAAEERYQQNTRDSECLSLKIPTNLFPKKSS